MRKTLERSTDTFTKRTEYYKIFSSVKRVIPLLIQIILCVCMVAFLTSTAPYIKGTSELENPLTTSQMTMMLVWAYMIPTWLILTKRMRK